MDLSQIKNRLYIRLRGEIIAGKWQNRMFPPEREFAVKLGVSRNTLRKALDMLEDDGLLQRDNISGTVPVQSDEKKIPESLLFCSYASPASPHVQESILRGAEKAAEALQMTVDTCYASKLLELSQDELNELLTANRCRGIILMAWGEVLYEMLHNTGLPVAFTYCYAGESRRLKFAEISRPGKEAWQEALTCLVEHGHKRIVTLTLPKEVIREVFTDEEYELLLQKLGLETEFNPVIKCNMNDHVIRRHLERLFSSANPPDAILCYSDYWALPVYRVLQQLKLRVPEDVSVMGYCGALDSNFISPKLTTVVVDYEKVGQMAVEVLNDSASWFGNKKTEPPIRKAPCSLEMRESIIRR